MQHRKVIIMRVIAGVGKGKTIKAVPGVSTRPTTDKVKESIFNIIGPYFEAGNVLDLFAGTGSLGIEALSRGMTSAIFVDQDKLSIETIYKNLETTNLKQSAEVYKNDYQRALKALAKREVSFDLIFLDPPYKLKKLDKIIQFIGKHNLLKETGTIVTEHDADYDFTDHLEENFVVHKQVSYGDTGITIVQFKNIGGLS